MGFSHSWVQVQLTVRPPHRPLFFWNVIFSFQWTGSRKMLVDTCFPSPTLVVSIPLKQS
uniref:Uncharacterized protein n=1 Tax=Rhizophora mucronata TaxID=61149 RepID=A0A2P2NLN9_RHIMU